jgi:hypothetical protein
METALAYFQPWMRATHPRCHPTLEVFSRFLRTFPAYQVRLVTACVKFGDLTTIYRRELACCFTRIQRLPHDTRKNTPVWLLQEDLLIPDGINIFSQSNQYYFGSILSGIMDKAYRGLLVHIFLYMNLA